MSPELLEPDLDLEELVDIAMAVADAARRQTLAAFRRPLLVEDKSHGSASTTDGTGFDPVTAADRAAESAMREVLRRRRPADTVRGEELADTAGTSGLSWVLDPIDGTRSFIAGMPTWGTLIAVSDASGPVLGIIDQPHIGERFVGIDLKGRREAWLQRAGGRSPLRTRQRALADAVLFTSFPEVGSPSERAAFGQVKSQVRMTRYSADCYAYAMLAAGHVDLVIEAGLQPHDIHALVPIVTAAGGVATGWDGGPGHVGGRFLAAASPALHARALALLASVDDPPAAPGDNQGEATG